MEKNLTINTLLEDGTLRLAAQPPHNWTDLSAEGPLTVPLIGEDYPAKTAVMWEAAYKRFKFPDHNSMMLADPTNAERILQAFRADSRYVGGGAGIGFKEVVVPHLDAVMPLAKAMGSVNIIKKLPGGGLMGDNTDGKGYVQSLESMLEKQGKTLKGARILMLGAGGTARAIGFMAVDGGGMLSILNRTQSKAVKLAEDINEHFDNRAAMGGGRELIADLLPQADAVVSTIDDSHSPLDQYSPLGDMPGEVTPEAVQNNLAQSEALLARAKPGLIVSDIRIRKDATPMLALARKLKMPTLDGIPMVVNQGVEAFWMLYGEKLHKNGRNQHDIYDVMWRAIG